MTDETGDVEIERPVVDLDDMDDDDEPAIRTDVPSEAGPAVLAEENTP